MVVRIFFKYVYANFCRKISMLLNDASVTLSKLPGFNNEFKPIL